MKTTLCAIRDMYRSICEFEVKFQQAYNLSLNEGMLLCSLDTEKLTAGKLAELLGLSLSNTSKIIKSAEQKKFIKRTMGDSDKRQFFFTLTIEGKKRLDTMKNERMDIPEKLRTLVG